MIEKAKAAKSAEELLELAKANNVEMTADEAKTYFAQLGPKCGALANWSVYHTCQGGYVWECNVCKVRGVLEESDNYSVMHTNRL